jgi:hypothetical protein
MQMLADLSNEVEHANGLGTHRLSNLKTYLVMINIEHVIDSE